MNALTIAGVELRRFLADRSNIFFVFIFPLLLVLVIGSQFGGDGNAGRVAVAGPDSELRTALEDRLAAADAVVSVLGEEELRDAVARGGVDVGVLVEESDATAYLRGGDLQLELVQGSAAQAQAAVQVVRTAVDTVAVQAGQVAALEQATGADPAAIDRALAAARDGAPTVTVQVQDQSELAQEFAGLGQFDVGAGSQLLLFVFLTSLAASATLIVARREGVVRRTLAAPVTATTAIGGQVLGRWVIALFQGGYIMLATAVLFGVDWGNLWLTTVVLMVFGLVAAGAAMLLGVLFDNEGAASGVGVGLGLVLAAIGGCMLPLELFPDTLRTIAMVTPHAWAYEALAEVQRHDAGLVDLLPQLGVLAGMAVVVLLLASWGLRRSLARAM